MEGIEVVEMNGGGFLTGRHENMKYMKGRRGKSKPLRAVVSNRGKYLKETEKLINQPYAFFTYFMSLCFPVKKA